VFWNAPLGRLVPLLVEDVASYYDEILPFYELETAGRHDLAFWKRLCRERNPDRVLELGSGLGRVTEVLALGARFVAGIDISLPMLARAHRRTAPDRLVLAGADMRRIPFSGSFDLVAAPSDPLSHLLESEDRLATLSAVAEALRPGGIFLLDGLHRRTGDQKERRRRVPIARGVLSIREVWTPIDRRNLWRASYLYRVRTENGACEKAASFEARAWDPGEVVPLFRSCGLVVEEIWGNFDRDAFTPGSPRIIVAATKGAPGKREEGWRTSSI
jgi:SAM-dependent methyltransferase